MGAIRMRLLKSYKHKYKLKPWPIGQVIQVDNNLASELLAEKIAELYKDEYPPKEKVKTDFFKTKMN